MFRGLEAAVESVCTVRKERKTYVRKPCVFSIL